MLCVYFPEQCLYNTSNQLFKTLRRFCCHPELVRKQTAKVCCADPPPPFPSIYHPLHLSPIPSIFHSPIFPSHSTYHSPPPVSLIASPDTSHGLSLLSLLECLNCHFVYQRHTYCIDIYQSCERDTIETIFGKM